MIMAILLCGSAVSSVSTIETSVNFDGAISSITSCEIALILPPPIVYEYKVNFTNTVHLCTSNVRVLKRCSAFQDI